MDRESGFSGILESIWLAASIESYESVVIAGVFQGSLMEVRELGGGKQNLNRMDERNPGL